MFQRLREALVALFINHNPAQAVFDISHLNLIPETSSNTRPTLTSHPPVPWCLCKARVCSQAQTILEIPLPSSQKGHATRNTSAPSAQFTARFSQAPRPHGPSAAVPKRFTWIVPGGVDTGSRSALPPPIIRYIRPASLACKRRH